MRRILQGALFATLAGALTFGAAAALDVNADNLGAGSAPVASCDESVDVSYQLLGDEFELVGAIIISDVSEQCVGQVAYVTVSDETSAIIARGRDVVAGDPVIVALLPTPAYEAATGLTDSALAADIYEVSVTITGAAVPTP